MTHTFRETRLRIIEFSETINGEVYQVQDVVNVAQGETDEEAYARMEPQAVEAFVWIGGRMKKKKRRGY